jgi:hypothetical protein
MNSSSYNKENCSVANTGILSRIDLYPLLFQFEGKFFSCPDEESGY